MGNIIEAKWLMSYELDKLDTSYGQIVQSWDTASKDNPFNDFSVCTTSLILGKSVYVLDVFRARLKFHELKAKAIELARLHAARVMLIEDASSGTEPIAPNWCSLIQIQSVLAGMQAFLPTGPKSNRYLFRFLAYR